MSARAAIAIISGVLLLAGGRLYSQAPQASSPVAAQLEAMKAANADLLQRQEKTLKVLDDMKTAADQIKMLGKRN